MHFCLQTKRTVLRRKAPHLLITLSDPIVSLLRAAQHEVRV